MKTHNPHSSLYNSQHTNVNQPVVGRFRRALAERFSLFADKAEDGNIERRIREGVELSGATPWVLIFAIFIASVGLNVNSSAVIIGAMLISPLMGPIMGVGLGVAIYDFDLVKRAILNLGIATLISLIVSTLYFSISPLQDAQSELLARTTPTVWDVLIAIFGGLAGIVGATRREKSNVIPGVAIATALMPPVCTAGFGIANGQWNFVVGALYLYTINCVFIGLATIIGLRVLRLKKHGFADAKIEQRVKLYLLVLALGTAIPSAYLAVKLVSNEVFKTNAKKFVSQEFSLNDTQVVNTKIDAGSRTIEVLLIGAPLSLPTLQNIEGRLAVAQLPDTKIVVHQSGSNKIDVMALKSSLLSDLYANGQEELRKKDDQLKELRQEISSKNVVLSKAHDISAELRAQYPNVLSIFISEGVEFSSDASRMQLIQLSVESKNSFSNAEKLRITRWFKVRINSDAARVNFEVMPSARKTTKR